MGPSRRHGMGIRDEATRRTLKLRSGEGCLGIRDVGRSNIEHQDSDWTPEMVRRSLDREMSRPKGSPGSEIRS